MNENGCCYAFREGADPTLVFFKGTYYLFVSMSAGFFYSKDLLQWNFHPDPNLLVYDYAPDVRQVEGYLYFCASRRHKNCPILRSADPLNQKFEEVAAPFPFWDPDLFQDEDGKLFLHWGCTNTEPMMKAVHAIQFNFANEEIAIEFPADSYGDDRKTRHIETTPQISCYRLEVSLDGKRWTLLETWNGKGQTPILSILQA